MTERSRAIRAAQRAAVKRGDPPHVAILRRFNVSMHGIDTPERLRDDGTPMTYCQHCGGPEY